MQTRAIYDHTNHVTIPTTKTRARNSLMWYAHYVFISALSVLTNKRYETLYINLVHTPSFNNFPFNHPCVVSTHVSPDQVPKSATFPKWAMLCRIGQYDFLKLFRIQQP